MLREIEIGKQYRLNIQPNEEYRCPLCDAVMGQYTLDHSPEATGATVTVTRRSGSSLHHGVGGCGGTYPTPEGMYHVENVDGSMNVPSAWLEPLEEPAP